MAFVENREVKLGDIVGFKDDVEQCGKIVRIRGNVLVLRALDSDGFEGDYIGGTMVTQEAADRCWLVD